MIHKPPRIFLGIDPGVTTGVAIIWDHGDSIQLVRSEEVPGGEKGFIAWLRDYEPALDFTHTIVCEDFILREGTYGVVIIPKAVIGALWAIVGGRVPIVMRPPAGRMKQVPDAILKRLGLHLPGKSNRNAREAVRHVVAYLKSQKHPIVLAAFE